jgi:major type 1 subunit fimbrin (pilin)
LPERVTDISCSIALNGGQHAGSGNVWLAPVGLAITIAVPERL